MIPFWLLIVAAGVTTWRISSLFLHEEGPLSIFRRIRKIAGVYRVGEISGFAELFSCMWCFSLWVGITIAAAYVVNYGDWRYLWLAPTSSAIAIVIDSRVRFGGI